LTLPRHGGFRLAVGYPNRYWVAQSSLAYQRVVELATRVEGVAVDRFFADPHLRGRSFENGTPLAELDVLAWSCSFELDAVDLLRTLDDAGIPRRAPDRGQRFPLLVMGGAVANINPLPLAWVIDVFVLGSAELLWPPLIEMARDLKRGDLLRELATRDGFFVPEHHLDEQGRPRHRIRRVEKRDIHMSDPGMIPASHVVTPYTEYHDRGLVEMSRGCPEKCRYCWVSFNYGRLRCYPAEGILDEIGKMRKLTSRVGLVATAVGDHPELPRILEESRAMDVNIALSSLRIPAMIPEVLRPLAASGAKSVTIAPETGTDALRRRLGKPISNDQILAAVENAQSCGIPSLKMYFIVGLPGETNDDLMGIAHLLRTTVSIMKKHGRDRGRMGTLHAGFSILVPKPYTPLHREVMLSSREARHRLRLLRKELAAIDNLKTGWPSHREALWQGFLSRGGVSALGAIEQMTGGDPLSRVMADHREMIEQVVFEEPDDQPFWSFVTSAPVTSY
jgi:radical SAM superfamily enzyme YgiQ (UPF0313 family)